MFPRYNIIHTTDWHYIIVCLQWIEVIDAFQYFLSISLASCRKARSNSRSNTVDNCRTYIGPRYEKTGFLHMRKQRRRSAAH